VHSVVSQGVIASDAQKLNLHAVCIRAVSGQLLFQGLFSAVRDQLARAVYCVGFLANIPDIYSKNRLVVHPNPDAANPRE
jgi:hypothetical protein